MADRLREAPAPLLQDEYLLGAGMHRRGGTGGPATGRTSGCNRHPSLWWLGSALTACVRTAYGVVWKMAAGRDEPCLVRPQLQLLHGLHLSTAHVSLPPGDQPAFDTWMGKTLVTLSCSSRASPVPLCFGGLQASRGRPPGPREQ
ncbi:hypothetical protein NDU88_006096 [Pleurodeles waltl]|uniref:Uncharacterized protein n=1 Tax=Pleurodeles waltl TaxID=8319 RepID=A0AAV7SNI7_PLEWA|nr:hypothetical protein NDU88_006096 [Pleurodeles waltl]